MSGKTKVVISSILKPVYDARNYKKIAISLAKSGNYEVYVSGYPQEVENPDPKVTILPLPRFKRLGISRFFQPMKTLGIWIKVKPELIIVNTFELLAVSLLYKILFGTKIIYDIQENYYRNLTASESYPTPVKHILAAFVRGIELTSPLFVSGFLLAEKCYRKELGFLRNPVQVIENKYVGKIVDKKKSAHPSTLRLVYTGTIASEYGIFEAIHLSQELRQYFPQLTLVIAGHCPNGSTWKKLLEITNSLTYINIIGGEELIPHNQIIKEITEADFALLPYKFPSYYSDRIPTRIFECLCLKIPMICRENPAWTHLFQAYDAFLFSDFDKINPLFLELLTNKKFYTKGERMEASWETEEQKLIGFVQGIFKN